MKQGDKGKDEEDNNAGPLPFLWVCLLIFFQIHLRQRTHGELQHFLCSLDDSLVGQLYLTTAGPIPNPAWSS